MVRIPGRRKRPRVFVTRRLPGDAVERLRQDADVEVWDQDLPPPRDMADHKTVRCPPGDRYPTELSQLVSGRGHAVADFTVSPLTAGHQTPAEPNLLRVEGTLVTQRNFGTMEISGPRRQRSLTMRIFDSNGLELWSKTIQAE